MRPFSVVAAILLILLNACLLLPASSGFLVPMAIASVVLAVVVLAGVLAGARPAEPAAAPAVAVAAQPVAAAAPKNQAEAEVATMLGVFQDKGRLVDFLMDDITPYSDAQVGAVARAVHQGCRAALHEHFQLEPVASEAEGSEITVPADYAADEFRLVGQLSGAAPFKGRLVHKGWRAKLVKLPRILNPDENRLPAIAPAQIELR